MAVTYVNASTPSTNAGGAFTVTGMTPAQAGNIIILQVFQDETTDGAVTQTSATNITSLSGSANTWTAIGEYQVGRWPAGGRDTQKNKRQRPGQILEFRTPETNLSGKSVIREVLAGSRVDRRTVKEIIRK